jgi:hypothetical protein
VIFVICVADFFVALTAAAQSQAAEQTFKNIQVLKGIPVDRFMATMNVFSAATGLNCTDCHTEESGGDWARYADDNPLKQRARSMVVMMNSINRANFGGRQVVTCLTCHRGSPRPDVMPSLDLLYSSPPPAEPGDIIAQAIGQPPAERILDRYLDSLGGVTRVAALTRLTGQGGFIGFDEAEMTPFELYARAPGQRTTIVRGRSGSTIETFDGRSGWMAAPLTDRPVAVTDISGQELDGVRVEAQMLFPAQIKAMLTNWRVGFPTIIDERDVQVVQGDTAGGMVVTLCFDRESGLLSRLVRFSTSPVGRVVTRVDYADYREAAGVQIPFKWTVTWLGGRSTYQLTSVQPNAAIDPAIFAHPR